MLLHYLGIRFDRIMAKSLWPRFLVRPVDDAEVVHCYDTCWEVSRGARNVLSFWSSAHRQQQLCAASCTACRRSVSNPSAAHWRSCMRCVCPSRLLRHSRNSRPFMAVRINKQADILTYILSIYQSRRTIERTIEHQSNVMREIHIPRQVCFPPQCLD